MAFPIGLAISIGSSLLGGRGGGGQQAPGYGAPEFQHHTWGPNALSNPIAAAYQSVMGGGESASDLWRRTKAPRVIGKDDDPFGPMPSPGSTPAGGVKGPSFMSSLKEQAITSLVSSLFAPRQEAPAPQYNAPSFSTGAWGR